ncbi:flagellar biosynthetic protein FliO [Limnobacter parvus]|uniref:Flagellar protein n=1 Tax=Limnobacter parvus TaxID=2939690 RepID=A0ABT1XDU2_9BURK|nr:flagellar biosynthetic protein FliO [Limnobacter parvus]MCR2745452.1 flagellar biosynthetic protein FliO [Limnobacter parvus]
MRLLFLAGGALLGNSMAWAQEAANQGATEANAMVMPAAESPVTGHLLQTTLGLLFVIGLLFALVWLLKRMGFTNQQKRGGFYKVLATSALGPREKIVLVEVGDTWLMLGMTSNSITTLHSMPAGSIELEQMQNPAANFAKMLERMKNPKVKP